MKRWYRYITLALMGVLSAGPICAQRVTRVTGQATFYGESYDSPAKCRQEALAMARTDAMGRAFGWTVQGATYQQEVAGNDREDLYFNSTNSMSVNGEWVSDEDVKYEYMLGEDGCLIVKCQVKGNARRASNESIDFEASALRNGRTRECIATEYVSGDPLYLLVNTPVDGYLAVYLADDAGQTYCLLPYKNSVSESVRLRRDQDYVFFDKSDAEADGMRLVTDSPVERDELIVVFSPNAFSKATDKDTASTLPRVLPMTQLNEWLLKVQRNDPRLSIKRIPLYIKNK